MFGVVVCAALLRLPVTRAEPREWIVVLLLLVILRLSSITAERRIPRLLLLLGPTEAERRISLLCLLRSSEAKHRRTMLLRVLLLLLLFLSSTEAVRRIPRFLTRLSVSKNSRS